MGAEEAAAASGGSSLPMMIAVAVVAITVVLFLVFRKKAPTPDALVPAFSWDDTTILRPWFTGSKLKIYYKI